MRPNPRSLPVPLHSLLIDAGVAQSTWVGKLHNDGRQSTGPTTVSASEFFFKTALRLFAHPQVSAAVCLVVGLAKLAWVFSAPLAAAVQYVRYNTFPLVRSGTFFPGSPSCRP
ncbi:hypothetical protein N658DRAFT_17736 [Parathielavia hyrcaniae]|uniref:Uncharacterized protein n=1 Tax=Parathielavia hyrcaniae TaxID=113614 RepID=A0AAN6QFB7_9PEZI|nr:hypothetical protein N658DRAFT_17736 [Parathielavia hyrcaniae]